MKINNPLQEISRKYIEKSIYNRDYRNLLTKIVNHNKKFNDNISTDIEFPMSQPNVMLSYLDIVYENKEK